MARAKSLGFARSSATDALAAKRSPSERCPSERSRRDAKRMMVRENVMEALLGDFAGILNARSSDRE
ncbi:MAG TPA: hypothetical protein VFF17_11790 [Thermoanaerobaculia bacterium]|nr:hypothetical protein [Thermoanaerobaculia bacterium]